MRLKDLVTTIQGHVKDKVAGTPIANASINWTSNNKGVIVDAVTDSEGYYIIYEAAMWYSEDYIITVSASNYVTLKKNWIGPSGTYLIEDFYLQKVVVPEPTPEPEPTPVPTPTIPGLPTGPVMTAISQVRSQISARRAKWGIPSLGVLSQRKTAPVTQAPIKTF